MELLSAVFGAERVRSSTRLEHAIAAQRQYSMEQILGFGDVWYDGRVCAEIDNPTKLSLLGVLDEIAFYPTMLLEPHHKHLSTSLEFTAAEPIVKSLPVSVISYVEESKPGKGAFHSKHIVRAEFYQGSGQVATGRATYLSFTPTHRPDPMPGAPYLTGDLLTDLGIYGRRMQVTKNVENNWCGTHGASTAIFAASQQEFSSVHVRFLRPAPTSGELLAQCKGKDVAVVDAAGTVYTKVSNLSK